MVRPDACQESQSRLQQSHQPHQVTTWPRRRRQTLSWVTGLNFHMASPCSAETFISISWNMMYLYHSVPFESLILRSSLKSSILRSVFSLFICPGGKLSTSDTLPTLTTYLTSSKTEYWSTTGKTWITTPMTLQNSLKHHLWLNYSCSVFAVSVTNMFLLSVSGHTTPEASWKSAKL